MWEAFSPFEAFSSSSRDRSSFSRWVHWDKKTPREHPHSLSSIVLVISSFFFPTKSIRTPIIHHHIQKPFKWNGSSSRLSCLYIRYSACCRSYLYSPFTLRLVSSIYLFYFFAKLVRTFCFCWSDGGPAWFQKMQHWLCVSFLGNVHPPFFMRSSWFFLLQHCWRQHDLIHLQMTSTFCVGPLC